MQRSELETALQLTHEQLQQQLGAIVREADRVGCLVSELRDTTGGFTAAPVLTAIASVQAALAYLQPTMPPAQCGVCRYGHATFPCVLLKGHVGSHKDEDGDTFHA